MPEPEICVDEAMCPFKGRSRFRIYMKDKPTRWGFKFYELSERKSGYVYRLELCCGQPGLSNKPHDVVMRLVDPVLKKGYHLYINNYYCEPSLCAKLATKKKMVCALLFKGSDLADSAGQGFTTARLTTPGTVCALPTFTQPSHERGLCAS